MSLRVRLLLAAGAVALIALAIADVVTYSALRSSLYQRVDQDLQAALAVPGPGHLGATGRPGGGPVPGSGRQPVGGGGTFVAIRNASGTTTVYSESTEPGGQSYAPIIPEHLAVPPPSKGKPGVGFFDTGSTVSGGPEFRVAISPGPDDSLRVVALAIDTTRATLRQLIWIELAVTGAALAVAVALGWWLVRVGIRPLVTMEATAEAVAGGALDARIPGDERRTEVGRLARSLNLMLARIQQAFRERDATEARLRASEDRLRRFVADASHELRTPLAAVSAYAELFARGAAERPADLARVMEGIRGESSRMAHLVEDLFLLARLDEGRPLERREVELVGLAAQAGQAAGVVGPEWPVRVEAGAPVEVWGDGGRLRQVLDNLLTNVRAHTPAGTTVVVSVGSDPAGSEAVVEVADDGPGLDEADAARVFDRFYRTDASRARAAGGGAAAAAGAGGVAGGGVGGTGLGLSIVAAIVAAHGGTVAVVGRGRRGGAAFTLRLPLFLDAGQVAHSQA